MKDKPMPSANYVIEKLKLIMDGQGINFHPMIKTYLDKLEQNNELKCLSQEK